MRKIIVNNQQFEYKVGNGNTVIKYKGKGEIVSHTKMTGLSNNDIDRGKHKRWFSIKPSQIADYIKRNYFVQRLPLYAIETAHSGKRCTQFRFKKQGETK